MGAFLVVTMIAVEGKWWLSEIVSRDKDKLQ